MKIIDGVKWFACDSHLPNENEIVMLTGDSGYSRRPKFLTLGYYDNDYRPPIDGQIRWLDVQNEPLSSQGWAPTHWAKAILLP